MQLMQYRHMPELAEEFVAVLPRFGAAPALLDWAKSYARMHAGRCLWDAQFVGSYPVKRCLNVGGAPYMFEFALRRQFPRIDLTTIDLHPERFPNAGDVLGVRILSADIESVAPTVAEKFDMIVFTEIFEHLRMDILTTMRRVRELLNDSGRLYLSMPNGMGWSSWRLHLLRGRSGPPMVEEWSKLSRLGHMGHVRLYSLREATEVLVHCGFTIEQGGFRAVRRRHRNLRELLQWVWPALADEVIIVSKRESMTPA
ncbi:MAG: class I SAM-dependent methyltransferase [Steroidobacteraceae bacterium]